MLAALSDFIRVGFFVPFYLSNGRFTTCQNFFELAILPKLVEITFSVVSNSCLCHSQKITLIISPRAEFLKPWECLWTGAIYIVFSNRIYTVLGGPQSSNLHRHGARHYSCASCWRCYLFRIVAIGRRGIK